MHARLRGRMNAARTKPSNYRGGQNDNQPDYYLEIIFGNMTGCAGTAKKCGRNFVLAELFLVIFFTKAFFFVEQQTSWKVTVPDCEMSNKSDTDMYMYMYIF